MGGFMLAAGKYRFLLQNACTNDLLSSELNDHSRLFRMSLVLDGVYTPEWCILISELTMTRSRKLMTTSKIKMTKARLSIRHSSD